MSAFPEPPKPYSQPSNEIYRCARCSYEKRIPFPLADTDRTCPRCGRPSLQPK